jgi:hypothetical protein
MVANGWSLRDLYRTLETPGTNRLRDAQTTRAACGRKENEHMLAFLLGLNLELAERREKWQPIPP